jgi:hypothetical protein
MTDPTYLLQVELTLTAASAREDFENAVIGFLNGGGFTRLAGHPSLSPAYLLRRQSSREETARPSYFHVWLVPTPADLDFATLMFKSADDPLYKAADHYVASETQEFTYFDPQHLRGAGEKTGDASALGDGLSPFAGSLERAKGDTHQQRYVQVVHRLSTPIEYGTYSFIAFNLAFYMARAGWTNAGISWNVTGRLRTFNELWRVDKGPVDASLATMMKALRSVYPAPPDPPVVTYIDVPGIYEDLSASPHRHLLEEYAHQDSEGKWVRV